MGAMRVAGAVPRGASYCQYLSCSCCTSGPGTSAFFPLGMGKTSRLLPHQQLLLMQVGIPVCLPRKLKLHHSTSRKSLWGEEEMGDVMG